MGAEAEGGASQDAPEARVLGGRFELGGLLGAGGMAEVYRAFDRHTGRQVALKILRSQVAAEPEAVERLRREADTLAAVDHPSIVSVETSGMLDDGRVYLAMELLEGETLGQRMRRGPMAPADLAPIVTSLAAGLAAAHQRGIVHRDLKPDNVYLCGPAGGPSPQVKILDFGVSKVLGVERLTRTGQILGTPRYMAPEQLTAERDLDARVDVYALGVILYEALAGQPPFLTNDPSALIVAILNGEAVPLRSLRVDLPAGLEAVVMGAMHRDPKARPRSITELGQAFAGGLAGAAPAVRAAVRTDALGSMELPGATPTPTPTPAPRPSTYSALEQPAPAASFTPMPSESEAAAPGAAAATPTPAPSFTPSTPTPSSSSSLVLPSRHRTLALVGAAAGVLAGLALLWATRGFGGFDDGQPESVAVIEPEPVTVTESESESVTVTEPVTESESVTESAEPDPETSVPERRRRGAARSERSRRGSSAERASSVPAQADAPSSPTATSELRLARRARGAGDASGCLEHVDRAVSLGAPAPALRLRADCLLLAGDRAAALDTYRRFCRLVPDHPAIGEVRATVASMGATCP
jgi:eukaryotic-like serine/threonine-protein kinase